MLTNRTSRFLCLASLGLLIGALPGCFSQNKVIGGSNTGGGNQSALFLSSIEWGRLVDVVDMNGTPVESDLVIRPNLITGVDYEISTNPVTEAETLTILQFAVGSAGFDALVDQARAGLKSVARKGPASPPVYSLIARNGALRLTFSDALDLDTVNADTLQFWIGDPATTPQGGRLIAFNDEKSGKGVVIFDPTISARQSTQLGLPQNASGFPASLDSFNDNLLLRIPTEVNVFDSRPEVLKSAGGRAIAPNDGSETEPSTTNLDGSRNIVRSMRTGNVNDAYSGFLEDNTRPNLVGEFDIVLTGVTDLGGSRRELIYNMTQAVCDGVRAKTGDVIEAEGGVILLVTAPVAALSSPYRVQASLLEGTLDVVPANPNARLTTRYAATDAALQTCFLSFSPSADTFPATGLDRNATISVRFDEPINATTVLSMHSMVLSAVDESATAPDPEASYRNAGGGGAFANESVAQYIDRQRGYHLPVTNSQNIPANAEFGGRVLFGAVEVADGNRQFTLAPLAGFIDPENDGGSTTYAFSLRDSVDGIRDLAGNPVDFTSFVAGSAGSGAMEISSKDPGANDVKYFSLRGGSSDEDNDGLPEFDGQFTVQPGKLSGRTPAIIERSADSGNEFIGAGNAITDPLASPAEPLTPFGAVVMTVYRPEDFGFGSPALGSSFFNRNEYNMDVGSFAWAPFGGNILDENFPRVSLALSHANVIPDEVLDISGRPVFPGSGLSSAVDFVQNVLGTDEGITEEVVFDSSYRLSALDLFRSESGQQYLPWPDFTSNYTWRDTAIDQSITGGAIDSQGSPPAHLGAPAWLPEEVPSIGLALLCRFRCYFVGNITPRNRFTVSQMVATSALPAWRVFSAGGIDSGGNEHPVIPDNSDFGGTRPVGGYANGQQTNPADSLAYWATADFVVRVSRLHTHWFDMGGVLPVDGLLGTVTEPSLAFQETGTELIVEYRGAFSVSHPSNPLTAPSPLTDAEKAFDVYGDFRSELTTIGSVSTPGPWTRDFRDLEATATDSFRYFQARISFISNADAGIGASLDGLGVAWDLTP